MAQLSWRNKPVLWSAPVFFVIAGLLGSVLPLLCQSAIDAGSTAGRSVSIIYVSNILGSTLGSLGVGFVLMNHFGTQAISTQLAAATVLAGVAILLFRSGRFLAPTLWTGVLAVGAIIAIYVSHAGYANLYGKMIFGQKAAKVGYMKYVVENRNGIVVVTADDAVFGGGVYDGYFNIDPLNDSNLVVRAYAVALLHPHPRRAFMLGLASGSWAQIVANDPEVESLDIVEINPGYLQLIEKYPEVRSLLTNPKVHLYIDDARRWLVAHPEKQYDLMVANATFHWRDHASQILSVEYLHLVKSHLLPGGVYYYNSTESPDVLVTGLREFKYGVRVINFLALSDSPFELDKGRWLSTLRGYRVDGKLMFDPADPRAPQLLDAYSVFVDSIHMPPRLLGMESGESMGVRLGPRQIITDDNMGAEWKPTSERGWH
jgi:spermidine synthase